MLKVLIMTLQAGFSVLVLLALLKMYLPEQIELHLSRQQYQAMADLVARQHQLDPLLFRALITQESAWNPRAVSVKGAIGLGQLMPATAQALGVDPYQPRQNLVGSARYLKAQLQRFGDVKLALCAYNAGPTRVAQLGRCPNFPETQAYVQRIMTQWHRANI
jgi:soluble lytic murein transglycosylase-like protein